MTNNVCRFIQRKASEYYRVGYTVSDVCSSIKMKHRHILEENGVGETDLWTTVDDYLVCNREIDEANRR